MSLRGVTGLWIGWCVLKSTGPAGDWMDWLTGLGLAPFSIWFPPSMMGLVNIAAGPACAVVTAPGLIALGAILLRWLRGRSGWPAGLFGFSTLGLGGLGLGLTGLYRPGVLIVILLGLVLSAVGRARRLLRHRRVGGSFRPGPSGVPLLGWLAPAAGLVVLTLPAIHHDALYYHLALPQAVLAAGRLVVADRQLGFTFPVTAELVAGFPLAAGMPQAVHWLWLVPFACALAGIRRAGVTWWRTASAGTAAVWAVCAVAAVAAATTPGKPDLAAAAYPLAALALAGRGPGLTMIVLLGLGVGMKWSGMIFLIAGLGWLALRRRGRHSPRRVLVLAGLVPVLPWLSRNWFALGDPVWPFAGGWFPGALLDAPEVEALGILSARHHPVWILPARIVADGLERMPLVIWTVPFWLPAMTRVPRPARTAVLGAAVTGLLLCLLHPTDGPRYALPAWMLVAAVVTAGLGTHPQPDRDRPLLHTAFALTLIAAGWLPLGPALVRGVPPGPFPAFLSGRLDPAAYTAIHLPAYVRMQEAVRTRRAAGTILLLGEERSLGLPGARTDRLPGRGPAWVLARDATDPARIRVRLRQWNIATVVANLGIQYDPYRWLVPYVWSDRMLRMWSTFTREHLDLLVPPSIFHGLDGGFGVYLVRDRPNHSPPAIIPYLPGADSAFAPVTRHALDGDLRAWVAEAQALVHRLPGVQQPRNLLAIGLLATGETAGAYAAYRPGIAAGWLDEENFLGFTRAAQAVGRPAESSAAARRARAAYPDRAREADELIAPP